MIKCSDKFGIRNNIQPIEHELKQGSTLLYRGKAYCTSQTDNTTDHTLNSNKYNEYVGTDTDDQKYIII